jgi:hypothetical protein
MHQQEHSLIFARFYLSCCCVVAHLICASDSFASLLVCTHFVAHCSFSFLLRACACCCCAWLAYACFCRSFDPFTCLHCALELCACLHCCCRFNLVAHSIFVCFSLVYAVVSAVVNFWVRLSSGKARVCLAFFSLLLVARKTFP